MSKNSDAWTTRRLAGVGMFLVGGIALCFVPGAGPAVGVPLIGIAVGAAFGIQMPTPAPEKKGK